MKIRRMKGLDVKRLQEGMGTASLLKEKKSFSIRCQIFPEENFA